MRKQLPGARACGGDCTAAACAEDDYLGIARKHASSASCLSNTRHQTLINAMQDRSAGLAQQQQQQEEHDAGSIHNGSHQKDMQPVIKSRRVVTQERAAGLAQKQREQEEHDAGIARKVKELKAEAEVRLRFQASRHLIFFYFSQHKIKHSAPVMCARRLTIVGEGATSNRHEAVEEA